MYLKQLRQHKLFSQGQVAEKSGLSLRTIQRAESGHRVGYASLRALAVVFDLDVDKLEQELYSMDKVKCDFFELPVVASNLVRKRQLEGFDKGQSGEDRTILFRGFFTLLHPVVQ